MSYCQSCAVSISVNLEGQAVHIEPDDHPDRCLFAVEEDGQHFAPVFRRTYQFLRQCRAPLVIILRVPAPLSYRRRQKLARHFVWLVLKVLLVRCS